MDCSDLTFKRITVFAGHYGSGKTNVAINYAAALSKLNKKVSLADLDIVNPYFRTKDSAEYLKKMNIRLISSEFANSNVDTPALSPDTYSILEDKGVTGVIDLGGDDRGALAMGRYSDFIKDENDYEMLLVINKYRFLTKTPEDTVLVARQIEDASNIKFTGIVNNSNLGDETTEDTVLEAVSYANKVSELLSAEIKMTTVERKIYGGLKGKIKNLMPIDILVRQSWLRNDSNN